MIVLMNVTFDLFTKKGYSYEDPYNFNYIYSDCGKYLKSTTIKV